MVPIIYKLVDLDGIDLAEINGSAVSGIYQKITLAMSEDKIEIFYNWYYAGLMIPPSYVSIDNSVSGRYVINGAILVTSDDRVSQIGNVPVIQTLNVVENGTYQVPSGVTGFGPVVVEVPPPTLVQLNASENGTYEPGTDEDGFSKVVVNVPIPQPVLQSLSVTENGIYNPGTGVDGFSSVTVDVPSSPAGLVTPLHYDLENKGYLSSGRFYYDPSTGAVNDVFAVVSGHHYICALGNPVGNRFRCAFFTTDVYYATSDVLGTRIDNDWDNPVVYDSKKAYVPSEDGFIVIGKCNNNITGLKSYLIELEQLLT